MMRSHTSSVIDRNLSKPWSPALFTSTSGGPELGADLRPMAASTCARSDTSTPP